MEIRKAIDSDEKELRELFHESFGREISYDEWAWKYKFSPWGSSSIVALDKRKVVAHYGGIKTIFVYGDDYLTAYQPCDVMTHPAYRAKFFTKRGLIVKAGEVFFTTNRMDFAYGFPSERHALLGIKQLGYTRYDYTVILKREVRKKVRIINPLINIQTQWSNMTGNEIDTLWERVRKLHKLSIVKNSSYIFWRYRDNPSANYKPLILRSFLSKKVEALGIYRLRDDELLILEILCNNENKLIKLIGLLEEVALRENASSLSLWLHPKDSFFKTLLGQGFIISKGIPLSFKVFKSQLDANFLFNNYCYSAGDYDAS